MSTKISISEFYQLVKSIIVMLLSKAALKNDKEKAVKQTEIDAAITSLKGRVTASTTNGALKSSIQYSIFILQAALDTKADNKIVIELMNNFKSADSAGLKDKLQAALDEKIILEQKLQAALDAVNKKGATNKGANTKNK